MKSYLLAGAATLLASTAAQATSFVEIEPNDTFATAQTLRHNGTIFVTGFRESSPTNAFNDFFSFYAAAGNAIRFTVNTVGGGDPLIQLRNGLNNVLAQNDDSGGGLNSLISFTIGQTGTYYGAVRGFGNSVYSYNLAITGLTASPGVPEPAAWAMMIAGFGLVGGAMRRRATRMSFAAA